MCQDVSSRSFRLFCHCVHGVLRRFYLTKEEKEMNFLRFDPWMRENLYKGLLFPLPDAVVRFALEAAV